MTFIHQFNDFMLPLFGKEGWQTFEIVSGFLLTLTCIMQRMRVDIYRNDRDTMPWFAKKILQSGLFIQMMIGLLAMVDGYASMMENTVHILFIISCIASIMVKSGVFLNISSKNVEGKLS